MTEIHQKEWFERAQKWGDPKYTETTFKHELFDLSFRATVDTVSRQLALKGSERIFDAGFGWGRVALGLKQRYPDLRLDGIELTADLTTRAHELFREFKITEGISLKQGDILEHIYPADTYDAVFSVRVFHYIVNRMAALQKIYDSLKKDGKIFISIPNRFCPVRWITYHHPLPSIYNFRSDMEQIGFKNIHFGSYGFLPAQQKRFSYDSKLYWLEKFFPKVPLLNVMGGLIYITGEK